MDDCQPRRGDLQVVQNPRCIPMLPIPLTSYLPYCASQIPHIKFLQNTLGDLEITAPANLPLTRIAPPHSIAP